MSTSLEGLYKLDDLTVQDASATAKITINKDHIVFNGHFPDNPVMPGVCMMQIIKEITEKIVEKKLFMQSASNIKFMALINPFINPELELQLNIIETEEGYKVKNISKFEDTIALKSTSNFIMK
ncbi:3-hydroxyacyl-[acyl-carrier-protein] dehydratase [Winogradskyella eximia]|jgi:3-hydroxyacyl-[acyl-carrier-protein] dehydratase|uniref:3-hydroxyacyl-[acyl-carrier-protein] dehydratase n=1 Tax=Winogradskyella eximia TaxID=262006 RepID=A0A3D9H0V8_9FLAO|nr:3-hydroxyacyl-ACP dehydratase [Winogradskyella eximia]RED43139.1 3-hydroxyacyl-[acyl-carrier-protein] dehydratase [Winogradskyella eximia]